MKKGFTLIEMLTVVLIIGVLTAMALPNYTRSLEKARATEAMNMVRAANDAVYAYAAERNKCPESFRKIMISIPGTSTNDTTVTAKHFIYRLNSATNAPIPGTDCGGVVAERSDGSYKIWNPYRIINAEGKRTLACAATNKEGIGACKALGFYTTAVVPN